MFIKLSKAFAWNILAILIILGPIIEKIIFTRIGKKEFNFNNLK
jgi:hypothetical protein